MSSRSILLVEPPEHDRPIYAECLRANGFTVTEVESTDDGFLAAPLADLIITGIRMPGSFDGIELVRRLRAAERAKHKPVIVLTVCTLEPDQARAFAVGCDVFLPKPCLPETLLAEVQRLINQASDAPRTRARKSRRNAGAAIQQSNDRPKKRRSRKSIDK
jgi:two-component system, cell cycle response regulator DivK